MPETLENFIKSRSRDVPEVQQRVPSNDLDLDPGVPSSTFAQEA